MRFCSLLHGFLFKSHDLSCYVKPRRYSLFYISIKAQYYVINPHQVHLSKTTKHWDGFVSHCILHEKRTTYIANLQCPRHMSWAFFCPSPLTVCPHLLVIGRRRRWGLQPSSVSRCLVVVVDLLIAGRSVEVLTPKKNTTS